MAQEEFLDDPMPDILDQWRFYFSILGPAPDDTIVDIGCHTGDAERLLLREYPTTLKAVGIERHKKHIESALAKWEKDGRSPKIAFILADAEALPFPEHHFDGALCVETVEWIDQPVAALQEMRRVLKPDGVAVIIHSDFDTQVFNTGNRELCRRIVHAFADSGPNGQIGRELYGLCKKAGFATVEPMVYTLVNTEWSPKLYAYKVAHMMADWLTRKSVSAQDELGRWMADLEKQRSDGVFFYSINRYICHCIK